MNKEAIIGQRWISDTELQMGLGTILAVDHRTVTVVFLATGETRVYAKQTAPLTRVRFSAGDCIISHEGLGMMVDHVSEQDGLITYHGLGENGKRTEIPEAQLDNFIQLSQPVDRLFSGQIDQNKWFELRYETQQQVNRLAHSSLFGLSGTRTSLIPHQLFIAHEVAKRYAPRVLLADEVGLGKTIEAGLIIHQQLLRERAKRVLIIVPETLLHQWLVEMLRRFNLHFSIFDEERCQALENENPEQSPFLSEQLVLCNIEFFTHHPKRVKQALEADWDLLVVDEAHHLQWTPENTSNEYKIVEAISTQTKGVLLLTATPEQLGKSGHFARLRLLDPDRFPDLDSFLAEEKTYEPIAQAIEELLHSGSLGKQSFQILNEALQENDNRHLLETLSDDNADKVEKISAQNMLIDHLLDRHGTGRILFRNTRAAVKGFPERRVHAYPLAAVNEYVECFKQTKTISDSNPELLLSPEILYKTVHDQSDSGWGDYDPRITWLRNLLGELKPEKVLVITAHAETVLDIIEKLRTKSGIHAAAFHEGMSIIERDRAAAFFADQEIGSQVLICSEIGSEGRNFQFSHHLVLFDLPLNPDLLEQRIGRLDRIGQSRTINIHIPYLDNSPQAVMYHWYHEGLNAFQHTCPAGHDVFVQVKHLLLEALQTSVEINVKPTSLIETTQSLHKTLNNTLHKGRDRLLEYNSCRMDVANQIKQQAENDDIACNPAEYLSRLFDCYGVETEDHSEHCYILRPGSELQTHAFPGLPDEGMTVTYERKAALVFEDAHYLTWEHPMVSEAMDMVLTQEQGNSALTSIQHKSLPPGTLLIECVYVVTGAANTDLNIERYLPPTSFRILLDANGKNLSNLMSHTEINHHCLTVNDEVARKVILHQEAVIRQLLGKAGRLAEQQTPTILDTAVHHGRELLFEEINRLKELQEINPNIRQEEITYFEQQWTRLNVSLEAAVPRLDAIRVIVAS